MLNDFRDKMCLIFDIFFFRNHYETNDYVFIIFLNYELIQMDALQICLTRFSDLKKILFNQIYLFLREINLF